MPAQKLTGFIGPSYSLRNIAYDCQTCKNWLLEVDETGKGRNAEPAQYIPRPGSLLSSIGQNTLAGPLRGEWSASNGNLYMVFGSSLYKITTGDADGSGWSATLIYNSIAGEGRVAITDNSLTMFISAGTNYAMDLTTEAVTILTGGAYADSSSLAFLDSYVLFSKTDSNQFFWTDLLNTTADALNFASAEANPDKIVGLIVNKQDIIIGNETSIEVWYDYGEGNIVFQRYPNRLIETGVYSAKTMNKLAQTVFFLGKDTRGGAVMNYLNGDQPVRVSTFPMETKWGSYTDDQLRNSYTFTMQYYGHDLLIFQIPGADETFVFDFTASKMLGQPVWVTWTSQTAEGTFGQYIGGGHVYHNGYHISGSNIDGTLFIMDDYTYTDLGNTIQWERASPHITNSQDRITYDQVVFDFLTGRHTDLTLDPTIVLQYSDDGGFTWSNERFHSAGIVGNYGMKVNIQRLGTGRFRVFRIRCTDPIYWSLSGAVFTARGAVN